MWSRVQNDQVDFVRSQNVDQLPQQLQFHIGCGRFREVNRDIHVAQGAALAPGKSAKEIGENDLGVGPEVLRGQRQTLFDVFRQWLGNGSWGKCLKCVKCL